MQCNIDARGKAARLIMGLAMVVLAIGLAVVTGLGVLGPWGWAVAGVIFCFGAFGVFEGWAGWCVVRAMGFKTRV